MTKRFLDAVYFLILCACCAAFLRGITSFYPLNPWDESYYLWLGTKYTGSALPAWGPLYSLFYKVLHFFVQDLIQLFYTNLAIQVSSLSILHYLVSRRLGVSALYSFIGAFLVLISTSNAPIGVKINHFDLSCLYLSLLATSFFKNEMQAVLFLGFTCSILIYVRPDNIVLSFLFLAYWVFLVFRSSIPRASKWVTTSSVILAVILLDTVLINAIGTPFSTIRSWTVYTDYFFWNNSQRLTSGAPVTQNILIERIFGSSQNVLQALWTNPLEFLRNLAVNISNFVTSVRYQIADHFPITHASHENFFYISRNEFWVFLALFSALTYWFYSRDQKTEKPARFHTHHPFFFRLFFLFVLFCSIRAAINISIFSGWPRYYFEFFFSFWLLSFAVIDFYTGEKKAGTWIWIPVLFLLICPNHRNSALYPAVSENGGLAFDSVKKTCLFLNGRHIKPEAQWFCLSSYSTYVADPRTCISPWEYFESRKNYADLTDFLTQKKCGLVILDETMTSTLTRLGEKGDLENLHHFIKTQNFLKTYEEPGQTVVWECPKCSVP